MCLLIPISNLKIEETFLIKSVTFSSKIALEIDSKPLDDFLKKNKRTIEDFEHSFIICDIGNNFSKENIKKSINRIDLYLDSLRIYLNSFKFCEQKIGTLGLNNGKIRVGVLDDDYNFIKWMKYKESYYSLIEGIGADITKQQVDSILVDSHFLFLSRKDEVYKKYRNILHKACKAMQIYDLNNCFTILISLIENLDFIESKIFSIKKHRIVSFIAENQNEYEKLSEQFYIYSKEIRTRIVHSGELFQDLLLKNNIYKVLDELYFFIVDFSKKVIESGETTFDDLEIKIIKKMNMFNKNKIEKEFNIENDKKSIIKKCDYHAEIENLKIKQIIKINNTIIIPANYKKNLLKLRDMYEYGLMICQLNNKEEHEIKITSEFPHYDLILDLDIFENSLTVWDIDLIYMKLYFEDTPKATAIIENQPYLNNLKFESFDFYDYCEFSDLICNTIQKCFAYFILLNPSSKKLILPSKVGISEQIRGAKIRPCDSNKTIIISGRVFSEYTEPSTMYVPILKSKSVILYKCLYDNKLDEVFLINQSALYQLADCMYIQDINYKLIRVFNILDMLNPKTYDGKKLLKQIATFISNTKEEKNDFFNELEGLRISIRNPLLHGGKNINELFLTEDKGLEIFDRIKTIIILYCKSVYVLNIKDFIELREKEKEKNQLLN